MKMTSHKYVPLHGFFVKLKSEREFSLCDLSDTCCSTSVGVAGIRPGTKVEC